MKGVIVMSYTDIVFDCAEVQVDGKLDEVARYDAHLPHEGDIADYVAASWRESHDLMVRLANERCGGAVESMPIARQRTSEPGKLLMRIRVIAKPGKRLSSRVRDALDEFFEAQFCDGWGESVFGMGNLLEDAHGVRYYID